MYLCNMLSTLILSVFLLFSVATASSLTVAIHPSAVLPNPNTLPPSTHATLTTLSVSSLPEEQQQSLPLRAPLTRSSAFVFRNLTSSQPGSPSSYLLDIHARDIVFAPLRVDVGADGAVLGVWEMPRGNGWENKGLEKFTVTSSIQGDIVTVDARALAKREYLENRPKCEKSPPAFILSLYSRPVAHRMYR